MASLSSPCLELVISHGLVLGQWIPELQHYAPGVPVVLVGTKLGRPSFSDCS